MADAPEDPKGASLLSVLSQLPADVVETNILKIIGRDGVRSLMLCSCEAASVVRISRSTLTLRAVADDELTLQKVQDRAARLGLYTSAHTLTLVAGRPDDVNFLMVSTTMVNDNANDAWLHMESAYRVAQRQVLANTRLYAAGPSGQLDAHC